MKEPGICRLYLCDPRKNTACRKRRCVFDGQRRYNLKNGCYLTTDKRYAVRNVNGKPMRLQEGLADYMDLLRCIEAECYGPPDR